MKRLLVASHWIGIMADAVATLLLFLPAVASAAGQPTWYLIGRHDGCADLQILVRMEGLSRAPDSPEDFAQMMRERGEQVVVGLPPDFPPEFAGKVVEVKVGREKSPIFVTEEICRQIERVR